MKAKSKNEDDLKNEDNTINEKDTINDNGLKSSFNPPRPEKIKKELNAPARVTYNGT